LTAELDLYDGYNLALEAGIVEDRGQFSESRMLPSGKADCLIVIHLGPAQRPEIARIWKSQWPTVTALNYSEGREFHVRLRRHDKTGYFLVYASVTRTSKNADKQSIFAEVLQRGRVCRSLDQVKAAIPIIKKELGIEHERMLPP